MPMSRRAFLPGMALAGISLLAERPTSVLAADSKPNPTLTKARRAGAYLYSKLGASGVAEFNELMGVDQEQLGGLTEEDVQKLMALSDICQQNLQGDALSTAADLLNHFLGGRGEDNTEVGAAPSKAEAAREKDQPPYFEGRPERNSNYAHDSRRRSPVAALNDIPDSGSESRRRFLKYLDNIGVPPSRWVV